MLSEVSAKELEEWAAYYAIEPFGHRAANLNFALLFSLLLNMFSKKGAKRVEPSDVMIGLGELSEAEPQTPEELADSVKALAIAFGAVPRKRGEKKKDEAKRGGKKYGEHRHAGSQYHSRQRTAGEEPSAGSGSGK